MAVSVDNIPQQGGSEGFFRTMNYADLKKVVEIEERAYTHPWTIGIFRDCIRVGYSSWVYMLGERIAGYGIIMLAPGEAHILNICIDPELQGRGLGRIMLRQLIDKCRQTDIDMVILEVRHSNEVAMHLYQGEGFHELGVRKDYYPADDGREDAIIYAKYISPMN